LADRFEYDPVILISFADVPNTVIGDAASAATGELFPLERSTEDLFQLASPSGQLREDVEVLVGISEVNVELCSEPPAGAK
jgi:hypothetical protein